MPERIAHGVYSEIQGCRGCGGTTLAPVVDLGQHFLPEVGRATDEPLKAPLTLVQCRSCGLVQLLHTVEPHLLYRSHYPYWSGANRTMREALAGSARASEARAGLTPGEIVVDIGCNDGTMLLAYTTPGILRVGYEPSRNVRDAARARGLFVIPDYFSSAGYWRTFCRSAKVVTAVAVFYDVPHPKQFLADLAEILDPEGLALIQMNDLYSMVANCAFDIICHEHLCYYPLATLEKMLQRVGLKLTAVEHLPLNGGTLRAWIRHGSAQEEAGESVPRQMGREAELFRTELPLFGANVKRRCRAIREAVEQKQAAGGAVYVYGASTRGNTILQACGLDGKLIEGAAEINPDKIGSTLLGLGIPIVSEEEARQRASAFLVLPYSYRDEFVERERGFLARGGEMIFPLPELEIVGGR